MYYIRIHNQYEFEFLVEGFNEINATDIKITKEDYDLFYKEYNMKQVIVKNPFGTTVSEIFEVYTEEVNFIPSDIDILKKEVLEQAEYMLEMDYRLINLELGL